MLLSIVFVLASYWVYGHRMSFLRWTWHYDVLFTRRFIFCIWNGLSDYMRHDHISVSCTGSFDIPSDVHSCIFHDITSGQAEEMIGSLPLELNHLQRSVMEHQRAPKRYLLFQFCQKIDRIWQLRIQYIEWIFFISKITKLKAFCDWTTGTTSNV